MPRPIRGPIFAGLDVEVTPTPDGERLTVDAGDWQISTPGTLDRGEARELRDALTEWLGDDEDQGDALPANNRGADQCATCNRAAPEGRRYCSDCEARVTVELDEG